jgi:2-oxoisovalerate dehydrogenase E1 component
MFDRAKVVNDNFCNFLKGHLELSKKVTNCSPLEKSSLTESELVDLLETQMMSRLLDIKSRELRKTGKSFYTIASSGHEGMSVVGLVSRLSDMGFLHYRDCALFIQRSKKLAGTTVLNDLLCSFGATIKDPISGGRHKVLGSKKLFLPPQTSTIASHLPKAVGAALSVSRAIDLGVEHEMPADAVVFCTFGDASLNHASAQTSLNCAHWISYQNIPLPLVFICEDNGIGISVPSPTEWVKNSQSKSHSIKYFECDGLDLIDTFNATNMAFAYAREWKKPVFLRIKTVRLLGHAGSDIETSYRSINQIEKSEGQDPLLKSASIILENEILSHEDILNMYLSLQARIDRIAKDTTKHDILKSADDIMEPVSPSLTIRSTPITPKESERANVFGSDWEQLKNATHPMGKLINFALTDLMLEFPGTVVLGEDVAKKGGVYNITAKLEKRFGRKRVFNSLLDETSILGTAIGLAHNGITPIPEIQFLAYIHNAQDQLRGEAATLSFFSNNQFTNGMVIRVAGLAYQKGFGGHFHNDNSISIFRDLPGVVLACPSSGADAVRMMRTCVKEAHEKGKVFVFLEPIALYPVRDLQSNGDNEWCTKYPVDTNDIIAVGDFHVDGDSEDLCIVTYGNGYFLSQQAKHILQSRYKINIKVIDLRWLTEINESALCRELEKSKRVLIVDECRRSGSLSEGIMAMMLDHCSVMPITKRLCGHDSYIPLGDAANLVLPQKEDIIDTVVQLLGRDHD